MSDPQVNSKPLARTRFDNVHWLFWHRVSPLNLLPAVAVVAILIAIVIWITTPVSFLESLFVGFTIGAVADGFVPYGISRYQRRYIRSHNYCVCPKCGYPLSQIGEAGACPECGTQFKIAELREYWQGAL